MGDPSDDNVRGRPYRVRITDHNSDIVALKLYNLIQKSHCIAYLGNGLKNTQSYFRLSILLALSNLNFLQSPHSNRLYGSSTINHDIIDANVPL